jgi:hypothetical protein
MTPEHLEFSALVRCYNGALDSAAQRVIDAQAQALAAIKEREPSAHATYFPAEGTWMVHVWGRPLSPMCATKGAALWAALAKVRA